jgi:hypothetical protein
LTRFWLPRFEQEGCSYYHRQSDHYRREVRRDGNKPSCLELVHSLDHTPCWVAHPMPGDRDCLERTVRPPHAYGPPWTVGTCRYLEPLLVPRPSAHCSYVATNSGLFFSSFSDSSNGPVASGSGMSKPASLMHWANSARRSTASPISGDMCDKPGTHTCCERGW